MQEEVVISIPNPSIIEVAQAINNLINDTNGPIDSNYLIDLNLSEEEIKIEVDRRITDIEDEFEEELEEAEENAWFGVSDPYALQYHLSRYFNHCDVENPNITTLFYYISINDLKEFVNILKESN